MLWTRDLGTLLERRHGPIVFTGMVLLFAVLSNVAQFLIADPSFGGMSGVVYGMLGYIWIRGRTDPFYEIHLSQQTTAMMIGWFLIGFAAESLHIANTAHATGLALGMLTGFVSGTLAKKTRFSRPGSQ
jgi:GlpG protein